MQYRKLGSTGLKVSEIGFGCGNNAGLMTTERPDDQLEAVRRALDLGINYFDTSPAYGAGKSEANLGHILDLLRGDVVVSTKVRLGPEALADLKAATLASVEQSLGRLRRDSVQLIQLHTRVALQRDRATHQRARFSLAPAEVLGRGGVMEAFQELQRAGKVRYFGFSGLGEPKAIHALIDSGAFHSVQLYFNLLNPSAAEPVPEAFSALDYGRALHRAAAQGMGVVVIRVLAAGALTATPDLGGGTSGEPLSPGSEYARDIERAGQLKFLVQDKTPSLTRAAIRFALMKPEVSTVLVGFSHATQVDEAVACSGAGGLPQAAIERLRELWNADFGRLAGTRR